MRIKLNQLLWVAGAALAAWVGIQYLLPIALPFLLGTGLALLAEPLTRLLHNRINLPRALAAGVGVSVTFLFCLMLLLLLGALLLRELAALAQVLPNLEQTARSGMGLLSGWLLDRISQLPPGIQTILARNITGIFSGGSAMLDDLVKYLLGLTKALLSHVPQSALTLGTAIISSYMISCRLPNLKLRFAQYFSRSTPFLEGFRRVRKAIGGWFLAQLKLCGVTWGLLTLGFLVLGIRYALLWGILVALVDALPVLGTGAVLIPWSLISFLESNNARALGLLGLYAIVALTRSVLEPRLVGKQLGLDPLLTLACLYAGFRLWGVAGMIFAPLLAVAIRQFVPTFGKNSPLE